MFESRPTAEQLRFKRMVEQVPELARFWNWETWERARGVGVLEGHTELARDDACLLMFFEDVWSGVLDCSSLRDLSRLPPPYRQIIADWILDPFWP